MCARRSCSVSCVETCSSSSVASMRKTSTWFVNTPGLYKTWMFCTYADISSNSVFVFFTCRGRQVRFWFETRSLWSVASYICVQFSCETVKWNSVEIITSLQLTRTNQIQRSAVLSHKGSFQRNNPLCAERPHSYLICGCCHLVGLPCSYKLQERTEPQWLKEGGISNFRWVLSLRHVLKITVETFKQLRPACFCHLACVLVGHALSLHLNSDDYLRKYCECLAVWQNVTVIISPLIDLLVSICWWRTFSVPQRFWTNICEVFLLFETNGRKWLNFFADADSSLHHSLSCRDVSAEHGPLVPGNTHTDTHKSMES